MKIELPAHKKHVFSTTMSIRWGDMDALGHVNNAVYFRYMETARIEWLRAIACEPDPQGEGPVIVNAFCNFYRQLEYPGEVLAELYVSDPGRSSFETWCTLSRRDAPETVCAAGGATTVWVNFRQQKSMPMPQYLRAVLG